MNKTVRAFSLSVALQTALTRVAGNSELTERLLPTSKSDAPPNGCAREDYDRLYNLLEYGDQFLSSAALKMSKQFKSMAQPRLYTAEDLSYAAGRADAEKRTQYYAELARLSRAQAAAQRAAKLRAERNTISFSALVEALVTLGISTLEEQYASDRKNIERGNASQVSDKSSKARARKATSSRAAA